MKKLFAAAAVVTALATPAMSADMAVKAPVAVVNPAYDWSGFYFGAAVGGAWADIERNYYNQPLLGTVSLDDSRLHYAGFGGVQKQFGPWVLGVEAAWNSNITNVNAAAPTPPFAANTGYSNRLMDMVTVGGRAGYAGWTNWLVYATGGWAQARLSTEYYNTVTGAPAFPGFWGSRQHNGWYAGVGVEYMVYRGVIADAIIGAEYQHLDFASKSHVFAAPGSIENFNAAADVDIIRARLSFKFNPWRSAAPAVVAKY